MQNIKPVCHIFAALGSADPGLMSPTGQAYQNIGRSGQRRVHYSTFIHASNSSSYIAAHIKSQSGRELCPGRS